MSAEIMQRVQVDEITGERSTAIAHWLRAYDEFHAATKAAAEASIGGKVGLTIGSPRYDDDRLTKAFLATGEIELYDRGTRERSTMAARDRFETLITQEVDRRCWSHLLKVLQFDQLMDRQAREEFNNGLRDSPPAFTTENCSATFGNLWGNQREIYLRDIANTFAELDRRFRSHDGFKIGARLILDRAISDYGSCSSYQRRDTLRDVERVFRELDGQGACPEAQSIVSLVTSAHRDRTLPYVIQGDYFRVRVFNNGNLHIWFERKDLLVEVNKLLAEYYGEVIGDGFNSTQADETPDYHVAPAKDFGAFMSSEAVAEQVARYAGVQKGETILEPSAGTGMLARIARERSADVICVEVQPGLAHELSVLHQFPQVINRDFLTIKPGEIPPVDKIMMNPPFDRGRDCDHVRHAFQFLKPGGVLVAVMSARAEFGDDQRHKALHKLVDQCKSAYGWMKWHDLPPRSFAHAGTNVNAVILAIRKPYS